LKSANHLTLFLTEQLGPNWQELDHLLEAAHSEMKQANVWLAKRKQKSGKRWNSNHLWKEKGNHVMVQWGKLAVAVAAAALAAASSYFAEAIAKSQGK
jgi:hypothetical protein